MGDSITTFSEAGEGVWLNGPANLTYTYIGKEAGSTNGFGTVSDGVFFQTAAYGGNLGTTSGSTFETTAGSAGFLDFGFVGYGTCCVAPGAIVNGLGNFGPNGGLSLAVAAISNSSMYLMLGDGYGDVDFDDMVVRVDVSAVPLPATVWLFGTALLGFIGISRRTTV